MIAWLDPARISYGTALGSDQLNATAGVPGRFTYAPAAGTVLHAGNDQRLSVVFIPSDTLDYTSATLSVSIGVLQATPTIIWPKPANLAYHKALGAGQLDATATVAGIFSYTPPAGTVLHIGADQTLSLVFTPSDALDYARVRASVAINVVADRRRTPVPSRRRLLKARRSHTLHPTPKRLSITSSPFRIRFPTLRRGRS